MSSDRLQLEMWSHFHKTPEIFAGQENRHGFLIRRIRGLLGAAKPALLNIGAGNGHFELTARGSFPCNVISVDPDEGIMSALRQAGIDARPGAIESLPVESAAVDAVVATEVLEHLYPEAMEAGLREIKRVLKPNGLFLGTVPFNEDLAAARVYCPTCRESFHPRGHRQSFTVDSLRGRLTPHFEVRTIRAMHFAPWNLLNWKGKMLAALQITLSKLGSHGHDENIFFECTAV